MTSHDAMAALRAKVQAFAGRRVTVGLVTYHYLTGTLVSAAGDEAIFRIGGREHREPLGRIATIAAAPAHAADFFK